MDADSNPDSKKARKIRGLLSSSAGRRVSRRHLPGRSHRGRDQPRRGPAMTGQNDVLAVFGPAHQIAQQGFGVTDENVHADHFEPNFWSKRERDLNRPGFAGGSNS
jgi:hypothetical protein